MTKCISIWSSVISMNLTPAPPTPDLTPASVKCNSILTHDFAKVWLSPSTLAKAPSPLLRTECSLLSAGGAHSLPMDLPTASVQDRHRQRGCSSHLLWGTSLSPGEIGKEGKPIVPIYPHLKQVPAKPWISKLFSHERHHHHYRKHPEAAGDHFPVPTSYNKSTPDTVYFKLLPREVTKMIVRAGHGSPVPVQDSPCASLNASSPSPSTAR